MFKDTVIMETTVGEKAGGPVKIRCNTRGIMGITADGQDLAAKLPVPEQDLTAGMGFAQGIGVAAGIQFDAFAALNEGAEDGVDGFLMFLIVKTGIFCRTVPKYIV